MKKINSKLWFDFPPAYRMYYVARHKKVVVEIPKRYQVCKVESIVVEHRKSSLGLFDCNINVNPAYFTTKTYHRFLDLHKSPEGYNLKASMIFGR